MSVLFCVNHQNCIFVCSWLPPIADPQCTYCQSIGLWQAFISSIMTLQLWLPCCRMFVIVHIYYSYKGSLYQLMSCLYTCCTYVLNYKVSICWFTSAVRGVPSQSSRVVVVCSLNPGLHSFSIAKRNLSGYKAKWVHADILSNYSRGCKMTFVGLLPR